ncbi:MAG: methylamine utilization protein [Sphingomonas bacterium]|nr:methylamine utilization protein [Sphingomonas bacterium]
MRRLIYALALTLPAAPAAAGTLVVRVVDAAGRPVDDAVVTIDPAGRAPQPSRGPGPYRIEQRNRMFHPFVSVVPVGAIVSFPNFDATRHQVYSFSPAKRFELKLFARDQSRSIRFDKAGIVAIGCNIHDQMSAFLFVTSNGWAQRTERGTVTFRDAPSGASKITVWHPYLRTPTLTVSRTMRLGEANRTESFSVKLRPAPLHDSSAY